MILKTLKPPKNEIILLNRAKKLRGITLRKLAKKLNIQLPINLKKNKGLIGILLEKYLGANANNKTKEDFSNIGVELKSIPIDKNWKPLQSTFICSAQLIDNKGPKIHWNGSHVRKKIKRILWIPIEGEKTIPLHKRRILNPFLWSPSLKEERILKQDWEEIMDMIVLGKTEHINAHYGTWLQLRTKGTNKKSLTKIINEWGELTETSPRSFYLKTNLTNILLKTQKSID